jgi:hypothetical protein
VYRIEELNLQNQILASFGFALPSTADIRLEGSYVRFVPNSEVTGYHFAFSTRYAARPSFPYCQREAQLLLNITQRGCA